MTDTLSLHTAELKDAQPLKTVERIQAILDRYNIKTQVIHGDSMVPNCHALAVRVEGTNFKVAGKGLTKELALASGYGELMERMQAGIFGTVTQQKNGEVDVSIPHDTLMSVPDALAEGEQWYRSITEKVNTFCNTSFTPEAFLSQFVESSGELKMVRFYDLRDHRSRYFPLATLSAIYGSNGYAAGNTPEEAIVQAISEITERNHQLKILAEHPALPEIPDEALQQYESAYKTICHLRELGYEVIIKDCSLGRKFPVVCACYIHKESGRYHTHFGASPKLRIALERTLTETFQGRTADNFTTSEDFLYTSTAESLFSELRVGSFDKSPDFFLPQESLPYNADMGFSGETNKILLQQVTDYLHKQGYSILVRDRSSLGFPACQVLVPGYSEATIVGGCLSNNLFRYAKYASKTLTSPSKASVEDYIGCLSHFDMMGRLDAKKTTFSDAARLSLTVTPSENQYLLSCAFAYVYYAMGNRKGLHRSLATMVKHAPKERVGAILCLKRYLALRENGYEKETVWALLQAMHRPCDLEILRSDLEGKQNPFRRYVLECDPSQCHLCELIGKCGHVEIRRLQCLVADKLKELDYDAYTQYLRSLLHA